LIKLVEGLPSITHLTFADIHFTDGNATPFHSSSLMPKVLPRLEKLELLNVSHLDFNFQALMSFLRSRRRPRVEAGKSALNRSLDTVKQLVLTYRPEARVLEHRRDVCEDVRKLRRDFGMSINIGPLLYYDT
jgi:hypothetical protein